MTSRNQKNQNDLNYFLKNYFSLFMLVTVILVLALGYFLVLKPKYDATLQTINDNFDKQRQYYHNQSEKLATLKALNEFYRKINTVDLRRFNTVLPDQYAKERLFGELDETISENGFVVKTINLKEVEATEEAPGGALGTSSPQIGKIDVNLTLGAVDYTGFKNLLRLLENNLRLFDVTRVSFSPDSESTSLVLTTYYYKNNPQ